MHGNGVDERSRRRVNELVEFGVGLINEKKLRKSIGDLPMTKTGSTLICVYE
jgi:hypothetical protein